MTKQPKKEIIGYAITAKDNNLLVFINGVCKVFTDIEAFKRTEFVYPDFELKKVKITIIK